MREKYVMRVETKINGIRGRNEIFSFFDINKLAQYPQNKFIITKE